MGLLACAMGVMLLVTGLYGDTWLQAGTAVAFWVSYGMAWRLARTEGGGAGEVVVDSPDTR
jgi:hypothetical protein